ncbi:hypothetical protein B0H67DRAFT_558329 [Lasiosphaeris hirsuta]|uniref:Uncharacterized protein n=1 Tax=Lasiosphaeris hirsuta TaxID=260670 RepID=A0AA39ZSL0_9PEZI|nr:hypothetical protein B0H67DRAFT_558329 [Lasiosphaeris hirsuta]
MDVRIALPVICVLAVLALYSVYSFLRWLRGSKSRLRYLVIWNTGVTWVAAIPTSLYILANGVVLVLFRDRLERWAGVLAAINSIPLFLGGRRNIVIYYFGLNVHKTAHCIIGLVVIIEGLLHAGLALNKTQLRMSPWDYLAASSFLSILLTSIPPAIRWFRRTTGAGWWLAHLLFSFASLVGMAGYIGVVQPIADATLAGVVAIYVSGALWILGTGYRYIRRRRALVRIVYDISHSRSREIVVRSSHGIPAFPGCYFYVYYPSRWGFKSLSFNTFVDSLPLSLAWISDDDNDALRRDLTFIVSHNNGTPRFAPLNSGDEILLDGPYGRDINPAELDTIVLTARGSGIIGLLSFAYYQVAKEQHQGSRRQKQRVDILWVLDHKMDQNSNVAVFLLYPSRTNRQDVRLPFEVKEDDKYWRVWYSDNYKLFLASLMKDCLSENCAVIACGDSSFISVIRTETATRVGPPVQFREVQYRPCRRANGIVDEEYSVAFDAHPTQHAISRGGVRRSVAISRQGSQELEVPIDVFDFPSSVGRELHSPTVNKLRRLFQKVRCRPKKWEHHVKGLVNYRTYCEILTALRLTRQQFEETAKRGVKYHKVLLPAKSIVCLKGKHRLAAASREFGSHYFWTVQLYYPKDSVVSFPALRYGMLLVIHYVNRIPEQWANIARNVRDFCVDSQDVQRLEYLAPSLPDDRNKICHMMKEHQIFRNVNDPVSRKKILRNILSIDGIITSQKTFHNNMSYLEIALDVLRQHIIGDEGIKQKTLFENLAAHWDDGKAVVEYEEGRFHRLVTTNFVTAAVQLVLFVLRHFPYLSNVQPLQDKRGARAVAAEVDEYYLYLLYKLANNLGFSTSKIRHGITQRRMPPEPRKYSVNSFQREWRGGKPPMWAFIDLQSNSFLPTLLNAHKDEETSLFVQADFIVAFFGRISYHIEESAPSSPPTSPGPSFHTDHADWERSQPDDSASEYSTTRDNFDSEGASQSRHSAGKKQEGASQTEGLYPKLPALTNQEPVSPPNQAAQQIFVSEPATQDQVLYPDLSRYKILREAPQSPPPSSRTPEEPPPASQPDDQWSQAPTYLPFPPIMEQGHEQGPDSPLLSTGPVECSTPQPHRHPPSPSSAGTRQGRTEANPRNDIAPHGPPPTPPVAETTSQETLPHNPPSTPPIAETTSQETLPHGPPSTPPVVETTSQETLPHGPPSTPPIAETASQETLSHGPPSTPPMVETTRRETLPHGPPSTPPVAETASRETLPHGPPSTPAVAEDIGSRLNQSWNPHQPPISPIAPKAFIQQFTQRQESVSQIPQITATVAEVGCGQLGQNHERVSYDPPTTPPASESLRTLPTHNQERLPHGPPVAPVAKSSSQPTQRQERLPHDPLVTPTFEVHSNQERRPHGPPVTPTTAKATVLQRAPRKKAPHLPPITPTELQASPRKRAPHRPPIAPSTAKTISSQGDRDLEQARYLPLPPSTCSSASDSPRSSPYDPMYQSKPGFTIPSKRPSPGTDSPNTDSPNKRRRYEEYSSQLSASSSQTIDNEQPQQPLSGTGESSARGRDLTTWRYVKAGQHRPQETRPRRLREFRYLQKGIWGRYFRRTSGVSEPFPIESFLEEQHGIFLAGSNGPEKMVLDDSFQHDQREIFSRFQQVVSGPEIEMPDRPSLREEFPVSGQDIQMTDLPTLREEFPVKEQDVQMPDRPSLMEEFLAAQEELYKRYPSFLPQLITPNKPPQREYEPLCYSSDEPLVLDEPETTPFNPSQYRDPRPEY